MRRFCPLWTAAQARRGGIMHGDEAALRGFATPPACDILRKAVSLSRQMGDGEAGVWCGGFVAHTYLESQTES